MTLERTMRQIWEDIIGKDAAGAGLVDKGKYLIEFTDYPSGATRREVAIFFSIPVLFEVQGLPKFMVPRERAKVLSVKL